MSELEEEFFSRWAEEQRIRVTVRGAAQVLVLNTPTDLSAIIQPGTLLVAWSADRARLETAAASIERGSDAEALLRDTLEDLPPHVINEDLFDMMPAFAAVRYRDRDLVNPAILPPAPSAVGVAMLPWAGVPLDPTAFSTVSWVIHGATPLSALVVCNPPSVDEDEKQLIEAIPAEIAELGIEPAATPAVAATFVATVLAERLVNKAADKDEQAGAKRYRDWARDHQRQQDAADRRALQQAAATRTRWRNMSVVLPERAPLAEAAGVAPVGATIEELLLRRIRAMQPGTSDQNVSDDTP